jgi:YbbR domain-containing protein
MHPVKHWITNNWPLKLLSLGLSLALWITVSGETTSEVGMQVPLEYRNVPADMEITADAANTVEVRLRGSANRLIKVSVSELTTTIDLSNMTPGEKTIPLTARNVQAPLGTEVVGIKPSHVQFSLVPRPSADKRVRP